MTLGLILVLGVSQIFIAGKQSFVVQQHTAALQENARFVLSRISRDLRQAGMFGCLNVARLPATTRSQLPAEFAAPISFANDVLKVITAVPVHDGITATATRQASDYGAQWLLATNCLDELRIAADSDSLQVEPGDFIIPIRQVEYRLDQHRVQTRLNGKGNFEVLIDDVVGFDMQFGLAAPPAPAAQAPGQPADPDREEIEAALTRNDGVLAQAAADLGLSRQALYRRMDKFGISREPGGDG